MIAILTWIILSVAVGYFAKERGRSPIAWGLGAALFSPLICFLILLFLKKK